MIFPQPRSVAARIRGMIFRQHDAIERFLYQLVDEQETTVRFWQEIRDQDGVLREIHEKYPVDKGYQKL